MSESVGVPHPMSEVALPQAVMVESPATVIARGPSPRRAPETPPSLQFGGPGGPGRSVKSSPHTYNPVIGTPPRVPPPAPTRVLRTTPPVVPYPNVSSPTTPAPVPSPNILSLELEIANLKEDNKRIAVLEGSLNAMASQNVVLQNENTKLREDMAASDAMRSNREGELLTELDAMRAQLISLEHHMAVTEGRFTGLLEATRQEWKTEAALGGRAEAARLTANLIEVQSSKTLIEEKELEIQKLRSHIEQHDALLLKANAEFTAKIQKAEIKSEGAEAQILQLTSALESLQKVVEKKTDFKNEMQDKVTRATRETQERDAMIAGLNSQLDKLKQMDLHRERQLEAERAALANELQAAGAQSLEDIKLAAVKERERCEAAIAANLQREKDLEYKIEALAQDKDIAAQETTKIQLEYDKSLIKISELTTAIQQDKIAHKQQVAEMKELMDAQKKELEKHWQQYGRVGGAQGQK
eukprot:TRINITY_DN3262_c1_g1_i1.p1 TRINITY_DN3262_c1_g1~~TRINITY_DN3262_c1_g1_i1.p1  ORF type:complete len:481 (+),score=115.57 TRINITY_DN3262_c1_g1_i1:33-1445(+)